MWKVCCTRWKRRDRPASVRRRRSLVTNRRPIQPSQDGEREPGTVAVVAIFSIVESCRRLGVPIREYLFDVLPGLADRSLQSLAELTPAAYAAKMAK